MEIGDYIKKKRESLNVSQRKLADYSGLSNATISRIESGGVFPDTNTLTKIAKALKVSPSELFGLCGYIEGETYPNKSVITIPIIGKITAEMPVDSIENILDWEVIPSSWASEGSQFFGLKVMDNSMEPRIKEDDIVIVRAQSDVESGDLAAVIVNNQNASIKQCIKHENGISLVSFNSAYAPKFFTWNEVRSLPVKFIGKAIELRGKF